MLSRTRCDVLRLRTLRRAKCGCCQRRLSVLNRSCLPDWLAEASHDAGIRVAGHDFGYNNRPASLFPNTPLCPCAAPGPCHDQIAMPIRNPFRRTGAAELVEDAHRSAPENGFKSTAVSGAQPLQIKEPVEYQLSGEAP